MSRARWVSDVYQRLTRLVLRDDPHGMYYARDVYHLGRYPRVGDGNPDPFLLGTVLDHDLLLVDLLPVLYHRYGRCGDPVLAVVGDPQVRVVLDNRTKRGGVPTPAPGALRLELAAVDIRTRASATSASSILFVPLTSALFTVMSRSAPA